nr:ORF1 [Torque teno mini virus 10]
MPYYWRPNYYQRRAWRYNRRFRRRRFRKAFYRRYRTQRYRRRLWVRKYRKRKLLKIPVKQFQPVTIRKCKVMGNICLFQGSPLRTAFNYTQYMYSTTPDGEPGGGGYAILTESLGSLWEDFEHLRNIWTVSNAGLPLVKYYGCTLYFHQSETTDYIVEIFRCLPMKDYKYTHADTAPNRMMLKKHTIKVPSRQTRKKRRPFKRVRVPPPSQFQTKWYFQKDICNIPLVMVLATSCDFKYPFGKTDWLSNNITLTCLNPQLFQNTDFQGFSATSGYFPKPNVYMYATHSTSTSPPTKDTPLVYLGNTKDNQPGTPKKGEELKKSTVADWGNPFYHDNMDLQSHTIWLTTQPPHNLDTVNWGNNHFVELSEPLTIDVRYNPERDTGQNTQIYLKENTRNVGWEPPQNPNLIFSGFPLFDITWGYLDWIEKVHEITNINDNYIFVIKCDYMLPKLTAYIPLDRSFLDGFGPYRDESSRPPVKPYDHIRWYPRVKNQLQIYNTIACTGPGCARSSYDHYLQAKMSYIFHFKWGGCPKTLEKPYDPCSQPNWIIPSNLNETVPFENPGKAPETQLQSFDWRRDWVKQTAIERIKKYTEPDEPLQLPTGTSRDVPAYFQKQTETSSESSSETEEEEETPLQKQIHKLRKRQRLLKRHILKRLKLQE